MLFVLNEKNKNKSTFAMGNALHPYIFWSLHKSSSGISISISGSSNYYFITANISTSFFSYMSQNSLLYSMDQYNWAISMVRRLLLAKTNMLFVRVKTR